MNEDRSLVDSYLQRREEAPFRALYRRHTPFLYGMAYRLTAGADGPAADLVQDAWIRAAERLTDFRWQSTLRTWLAGILINCHRESIRRNNRSIEQSVDIEHLAAPVDAVDTRLDLENALVRLPNGYREIIVLYYVYGYTHPQIATLMRIDEGTSKSQLARGRKRLAALLG